jgi:hypothetical protein
MNAFIFYVLYSSKFYACTIHLIPSNLSMFVIVQIRGMPSIFEIKPNLYEDGLEHVCDMF